MLFGVLFIAMPLTIVGNNFQIAWDKKDEILLVGHLKEVWI